MSTQTKQKPTKQKSEVRINKYLGQIGLASRRQVDEYIEQGRIKVNQQLASLGQKINPKIDVISFDDKVVSQSPSREKLVYYKVYKPVGYVSTTDDPQGRPTVLDLVDVKQRVYPVGRLDMDSEGLMLLINDGQLTQKLTHPKHHVPKVYVVWVSGNLSDKKLKKLRSGMRLKEGKTQPIELELLARHSQRAIVKMTLHEGMNRQIRRMMGELGLNVDRLKRVAIGGVKLGELDPGDFQALIKQELEQLV